MNQKGFSLLEILVVVAIIGIIAGVTTDIFVQIIKSSNKANVVTEIKQNGDAVLNQMERLIRNAEEVTAIGKKNYGGPWVWTDATLFTGLDTCTADSSDICAIIIKNSASTTGGYTKIQINKEQDQECNSSPFTTSDQDTTQTPYRCNGNIRLVSDSTSGAVATLKNQTGTINSSTIGQIITNTEKRSGVSVKAKVTSGGTTIPFFTIRTVTGKPAVVTVAYSLSQGIGASSRVDSIATQSFETTISLRNY